MFDKLKFKAAVALNGVTANDVAEYLGIRSMTLSLKVTGKREFTLSEIIGIQKFLKLTNEERDVMFFGD